MTTIATIIQWKIEATEARDAIDYAIRSIDCCGGTAQCTGPHAAQLAAGCEWAGLFLDREPATIRYAAPAGDWKGAETKRRLREALKIARETLAETEAILKAQGTLAQRRLALAELAETHEYGLAA